MKKRRFVNHPRYGAVPHISGITLAEEQIRQGFWHLRIEETMFPGSVLIARTELQNCTISPRQYYVDLVRTCRRCARRFIFFAKEQRYWFETLKFFVEADCVLCPECRPQARTIQRRIRRYSDLMKRQNRTADELETLVDDAVYLLGHGVLRNLHRLGALKNEALRIIPRRPGTIRLEEALAKARRA